MMKKANKPVFYMLLFSGILLFIFLILQPLEIIKFREYIAVLFPKGIIGLEQRDLLFTIQIIMLMVVIPVLSSLLFFHGSIAQTIRRAYTIPT